MSWLRITIRSSALVGTASIAAAAFSQTLPPTWWNIDDGNTTSHGWTFDDPNDIFHDSVGLHPWGEATIDSFGFIQYDSGTGEMVINPNPSGDDSYFGFVVQNEARPTWKKKFWMQMVFHADGPDFYAYTGYPSGTTLDYWNTLEYTDLGGGYVRWTMEGQFSPQPEWESFGMGVFPANTTVRLDSFYVGTHCVPVPEPVTMVLAGLGLAGAARRLRKAA